MFGRDSGDTHVLCPFDNTHLILAKSFNSHLVKCRKNHQHLKKVPCKFDRTHMVLKPELQHHHSVCPSRVLLDRELQIRAGNSNALKGEVSGPEIVAAYVEDTEEDWDSAPHYTTNALFSSKKSFIEQEQEEDYTSSYTAGNYDPSAAASSSSSSSALGNRDVEESFRRVPLAPSKAAQLSAPMAAARPQGSSSQVYQYSVQQAVQGLGRGRGVRTQSAQGGSTVNVVSPVRRNQKEDNQPARHLGRGIARFSTQAGGRGVGVGVTSPQASHVPPPSQPAVPSAMALSNLGRGLANPVALGRGGRMVPDQGMSMAWQQQPQHHQQQQQHHHQQHQQQQQQHFHVPQPQFEDAEDMQAQQGGTSSAARPPPAVGLIQEGREECGDNALLDFGKEMKALLLQEQLENARQFEQLKQEQERRHQQLMERLRQKQIQQLQQASSSSSSLPSSLSSTTTAALPVAAVDRNDLSSGPPPGLGIDALPGEQPSSGVVRKGRGRGPEPSFLRAPNSQSLAQGLQTQSQAHESVSVLEDLEHQRLSGVEEKDSSGVKENQKQDFSKMSVEEATRAKRKLEKKLKQIVALEKKASEGTVLSAEENAKIKKKSSISKDLEKVSQYL